MVRNSGWAARAVQVLVGNHIGQGVIPAPVTDDDELRQAITDEFHVWATSPLCDVHRKLNFYGLQAQVDRTVIESGSCLVRMIVPDRRKDRKLLRVPLRLQVLEPDYIDQSVDGEQANGNLAIQGVEFNRSGEPVAYHLFREHPQRLSLSALADSFKSDRVSAAYVLHIFRQDRPGQVHGIPWGAPCLLRLRDWDDYTDAQLLRQKIAACFVGFYHDERASSDDQPELEDFEPGTFRRVPQGTSVTFSSPPEVQGFNDYSEVTLREIAATYGVTYEQLTGDYRRVNFTSGRMGRMEADRLCVQWQHLGLVPQLCVPIWRFWAVLAFTAGRVPTPDIDARWVPPRREFVDPGKEVAAAVKSMRAGLSTLSGNLRNLGVSDPERHLDELAADMRALDDRELILDCDPRQDASRIDEPDGDEAGAAVKEKANA